VPEVATRRQIAFCKQLGSDLPHAQALGAELGRAPCADSFVMDHRANCQVFLPTRGGLTSVRGLLDLRIPHEQALGRWSGDASGSAGPGYLLLPESDRCHLCIGPRRTAHRSDECLVAHRGLSPGCAVHSHLPFGSVANHTGAGLAARLAGVAPPRLPLFAPTQFRAPITRRT